MFDLTPYRFILISVTTHVVAVVLLGLSFDMTKQIQWDSKVTKNSNAVELLFETLEPRPIKKRVLVKKIKTERTPPVDFIDELSEKLVQQEKDLAQPQQINFEDLKNLEELSPKLKAFLIGLRNEISKRQRYPYSAKRLRQTGKVSVQFDVFANGSIKNVSISEKSDYDKLNTSAFDLVASISKVKNFPINEVKSDKLSITVPIEYNL